MGLDLTAYANVKLIQPKIDEIECLWEYVDENGIEGVVLQINESFPLQSEGFVDGIYSYTDAYGGFSCAYSSWSTIRNLLSRLVGNSPLSNEEFIVKEDRRAYYFDENGNLRNPYQWHTFNNPEDKLYRLINFSDCEGVINHESCVIIYNELKEIWDDVPADPYAQNFKRSLAALYKTFELAAENEGVVEFH